MTRAVTERDFRMEEFRDAKPEDYEFRHDGKIVRKDRWQTSMTAVAALVMPLLDNGGDGREFELADVVGAVRELVIDAEGWEPVSETDPEDLADLARKGKAVDLRLADGSILRNAHKDRDGWVWCCTGTAGQLYPSPVMWRHAEGAL